MPLSPDLIKIAFASGPHHLNPLMIDRLAAIEPDLPLYVVAEFEPHRGTWIPYHVLRSVADNRAAIQAVIGDKRIRLAVLILTPEIPFKKLRAIGRTLKPQRLILWDEDLRPITGIGWAVRRLVSNVTSPRTRKWLHRLAHPTQAEIPIRARLAQLQARGTRGVSRVSAITEQRPSLSKGTTVVIPSRDGRELLETLLPALTIQTEPGEIIVSDNGSSDGTEEWLTKNYPAIQVIQTPTPLSFAKAVNLGIQAAKFNRILLLNNDMVVQPGFIDALNKAFDEVPDLFCATAQIFFPPGIRREETGKAVWRKENTLDFPIRCDDPVPGEDLTWVLYGSGGCSVFDTEKLRALGGVNELYDPAYVEDLDFGYRAWKQGWPSVFCADAKVEHRHRATTTRFYTSDQLDAFVEINYLRFLAHAIGDQALFRRLWREAIRRLQLMGALGALRNVPKPGPQPPPSQGPLSESEILALGNGDIALFPGGRNFRKPLIVIASPYLPFPLSHGGAVRIYNLMKRATADWDLILLAFSTELNAPPRELLEICREVILVRRHGTHYRHDTPRPDTVVEFDSESFRACLKQSVWQWKPAIVQLEFTQMAQYAAACAPAKTILIEHDITFDLHEQLLATARAGHWELQQQLAKWKAFEVNAWREVDCVVTMSSKDEQVVTGARGVACLPNGVDTDRFQPLPTNPEPRRLLFIGSFAHRPNALAIEFFLRDVWPLLGPGYKLHVIAGAGPVNLQHPDVEVDGFVADVRSAYARAEIVIVPLTASAGTNIKVLEAMAMGKVVVSTPAGINGLELNSGEDVIVAITPEEMAQRIRELSSDPEARKKIENTARQSALRYDWNEIARAQSALYRNLS